MLSFKKIKGKPNLIRSFTGLPLRDFSDLLPAFDEADKADSSALSAAASVQSAAAERQSFRLVLTDSCLSCSTLSSIRPRRF